MQRAKVSERELDKEALKMIYWDEIVKCDEILQKRFVQEDKEKTGKVTVPTLIEIFKSAKRMLTFKEINIIIRNIKEGEDFEYSKFAETLYDVRFELAKSKLMDTNITKLQEHLISLFEVYDEDKTGKIHLLKIQEALGHSKKLVLTPYQI